MVVYLLIDFWFVFRTFRFFYVLIDAQVQMMGGRIIV